jgi:hypothetical protein
VLPALAEGPGNREADESAADDDGLLPGHAGPCWR